MTRMNDILGKDGPTPKEKVARGSSHMSVGRRWKLRRNLVIYIASQHGASQRLLADVFDLPHSRIHAILTEMKEQYANGITLAEQEVPALTERVVLKSQRKPGPR